MSAHVGANLARAIGANISEIADQRGLTVDQIAVASDIRVTQLRRMIDGEDAINSDHIVKLAVGLRVSVADILAGIAPDIEAVNAEPEVDFETLVYQAHREGWAMQRA